MSKKKMCLVKTKQSTTPQFQEITHTQKKKKRVNAQWSKMRHFCHSAIVFLLPNFLSILGRKLFGEPEEKIPKPHHLFSFLLTQPNTLQKSFPSHFLSKVFHSPYFTSKQTHPKRFYGHVAHVWFTWQAWSRLDDDFYLIEIKLSALDHNQWKLFF